MGDTQHLGLVERAKGFAAGIASGLTKLAVGHPFDTIKVRLQCSPPGTYKGAMDCVVSVVRTETVFGMYKGCTPPAIGWMFTDSILMGSLHTYRTWIKRYLLPHDKGEGLPVPYQMLAGLGAGWTNSFAATPVELLKSKLQMQRQRVQLLHPHQADKQREFTGAFDCARQIVQQRGIQGLWHALSATLLFRSSFAVMFGSYEWFQRHLGAWAQEHRASAPPWCHWALSPASVTFFSGGMAAELYWFVGYPADVVKNRWMADSLRHPRYSPGMRGLVQLFSELWTPADQSPRERGILGLPWHVRRIYTGFLPCALRAFPTNAAALLAFETAMYLMNAGKPGGP